MFDKFVGSGKFDEQLGQTISESRYSQGQNDMPGSTKPTIGLTVLTDMLKKFLKFCK